MKGAENMRFLSVWIVFAALGLFLVLTGCDSIRPNNKDHSEVQPYLEEAKTPHNIQWDDDDWTPEDWIASRGTAKNVMDGFYASDIITRQFVGTNDIPVLEVGQGFMQLSTHEKRRVVVFVDHVFEVTASSPNGSFFIRHARSGDAVGLYTRQGLQLQ